MLIYSKYYSQIVNGYYSYLLFALNKYIQTNKESKLKNKH